MARHVSAASQLAVFIDRFDPAIARLVRSARRILRKQLPTAIELVYDNYNALAIGFASTERVADVIVSLAVYARGLNLYFFYGARLPDPHGLLEGNGNRGRFIRLDVSSLLERREVKNLLRSAIRRADVPLPRTGRGYTIVKSISAKQRPRRPI